MHFRRDFCNTRRVCPARAHEATLASPARPGVAGACEAAASASCIFAGTAVGTAPRWLCRREAAARCVKRHSGGRRSLELGWTTNQYAAGLAATCADETAIAATNADEATRASAGTACESLDAAIGHGQRVSASRICRPGSTRAGGPLGCRAAASATSHMSQPPRGPQPSLMHRQGGRRVGPDSEGIRHALRRPRPNFRASHRRGPWRQRGAWRAFRGWCRPGRWRGAE